MFRAVATGTSAFAASASMCTQSMLSQEDKEDIENTK